MFGIMRPEGGCAYKQHPDYKYHRMHYCGVCKTMGKEYGHKSRFLLNYDIVFLSELLSEISNEDLAEWEEAYQKINRCMTMPKESSAATSLQYAADANLLLTELKIEDHLLDDGRWSWRFASWFYDKAFDQAAQNMEERWGLSAEELKFWADQQLEREASPTHSFEEIQAYLEYLSEPTAEMTAMIFEKGAEAVDRLDMKAAARQIGHRFGTIAYWLDAFEDVEMDAFKGRFNPFLNFYKEKKSISESLRAEMRALIMDLQEQMAVDFQAMAISSDRQEMFMGRLRAKLALELHKERKIPQTFGEAIRGRWQAARTYAYEMTCESTSWTRAIRYQLISLAVFIAPRTPEYMGMGHKEALVFSWAAFLSAFAAAIGLGIAWGRGQQEKRKKEKRKKRRFRRRFRNFVRKIARKLRKRDCADCLTVCGSACCEACIEGCCQGCCDYCCNSCCESCFNGDCGENAWIWLLILGIIVIGLTVLLIILL
jgi:hypothetical protein